MITDRGFIPLRATRAGGDDGVVSGNGSQPAQQLRESLAEGARERRNRIESGLGAPALLQLDNCVFRKAARLATPLVDLLLDGLSLLIRDDTPGIAITTFQELGDALAFRHDPALQRELPQEEFTLG